MAIIMTGKERAAFRAKATGLQPLFQVGKGGIGEELIAQTDAALTARELIKLKVLVETSPLSAREAADELAAATNAEVIQVIGGVMVLYRYSPQLHEQKKKTAAAGKAASKPDAKKRAVKKKKSPFEDKKGRDKRIGRKPEGGR